MKSVHKKSAWLQVSIGILALTAWLNAHAADGMIAVQSAHDVKTTADRLEAVLQEKGMKVFARIDHAAGASSIGKEMRPTELVIFGNPKVGTGLMLCAQSAGIDLPMKALIWQSEDGTIWLGYNDAKYLASRHEMEGCDPIIQKVSGALANFAKAATS